MYQGYKEKMFGEIATILLKKMGLYMNVRALLIVFRFGIVFPGIRQGSRLKTFDHISRP